MIKGETVILLNRTQSSVDDLNRPIYTEARITVNNVLIGSPTYEEVCNDLNMYGKRLAFTLAIPKTDSNVWKDRNVIIRGSKFRTYGEPLYQTAENVPGNWNGLVKVEKYG